MKKKILQSLIYTLAIFGLGWVLFIIIYSNLNSFFYDYKLMLYNHELDTLFSSHTLLNLKVKYVYKSGKRGSIYYINMDSLSNIAVIESSNYQIVSLKEIRSEYVEKIDLSHNKTYTTIVNEPFPLVQQALKPRESTYIKITFEEPYQIESEIIKNRYCYFKGKFKVIVFGNTQNCSIVTLRGNLNDEILILMRSGKLYFFIQTDAGKSLLEFVNPAFL